MAIGATVLCLEFISESNCLGIRFRKVVGSLDFLSLTGAFDLADGLNKGLGLNDRIRPANVGYPRLSILRLKATLLFPLVGDKPAFKALVYPAKFGKDEIDFVGG